MRKYFLPIILIIFILIQVRGTLAASEWKTWGSDKVKTKSSETKRPSLVNRMFKYYHEKISSNDGASCPFYPTCSQYSQQAIARFGLVKGGLLTIDRFTREYPGMAEGSDYPLITKFGYHRPYDPVPER